MESQVEAKGQSTHFPANQIAAIQQSIIKTKPPTPLSMLDEEAQIALLTTPMHEVLSGLYIGDYEAFRLVSKKKAKQQFNAVIKVTAQKHDDKSNAFYYAPVPAELQFLDLGQDLADSHEAWPALKSRLPKAFALLDQNLSQNKSVLVFCSQGASRSVAVVEAYLIYRFNVTADQADNFVKAKRPQADTRFLANLKTDQENLKKLSQPKEALENKQPATESSPSYSSSSSLNKAGLHSDPTRLTKTVAALLIFIQAAIKKDPALMSLNNEPMAYAALVIKAIRNELWSEISTDPSFPKQLIPSLENYVAQNPSLQSLIITDPTRSKHIESLLLTGKFNLVQEQAQLASEHTPSPSS